MKLLAIDGNSIINRAFYGIRLLTNKDGKYTNGIFGFLNILFKLLEKEKPDGVVIAFDLRKPTFRHKMYSEYKAGRHAMPMELREQIPLLKEILTLMGHTVLECEGYEADDILGTLANRAKNTEDTCVISTGDKDSLQLVGGGVRVLLASTRMGQSEIVDYDEDKVAEKYDTLTPNDLIQVKALMGDSSDNIPGVMGIGEKTAVSLVKEFKTLEKIYENIDSPSIKPGVRAKLINDKENAFMSRTLGTIYLEVPIDLDFADYRFKPADNEKLAQKLSYLEMYKILEKLNLSAVKTQGENQKTENFQTGMPTGDVTDVYLDKENIFVCGGNKAVKIEKEQLHDLIKDKKVRTNDSKTLFKMSDYNIVFDMSLAAYLLNPSSDDYSPERLASEYSLDVKCPDDIKNAALFSVVTDKLEEQIKNENMESLLFDIEIPLAKVLASMEQEGFKVDAEAIKNHSQVLNDRIEQISAEIYSLVGYEFNLNSPKQLGEALFVKLQLPSGKKTKSGYSTSADVLEDLRDKHPVIELLLEYRTLSKLKSTYCDALLTVIADDGRIHTTFNQTETRTGRISSLEPNLQNIPIRSPQGRQLRKFFTASQGKVLCDADYSQIELRVLSHLANDKAMINAFKNDEDIHTLTASEVFNIAPIMVTSEMRTKAKAVNFGIVYGIGAFSLAKDIGVSFADAKRYIEGYMKTYTGVAEYMEKTVNFAHKNGYVETMFARRRQIPEISSSNHNLRAFGERVARNAPIQGTAADIIKIAMIRVFNALKEECPEAKLILQVHDELIVECEKEHTDTVCNILKREMENAANLKVPLTVDVSSGETWYEAKG